MRKRKFYKKDDLRVNSIYMIFEPLLVLKKLPRKKTIMRTAVSQRQDMEGKKSGGHV